MSLVAGLRSRNGLTYLVVLAAVMFAGMYFFTALLRIAYPFDLYEDSWESCQDFLTPQDRKPLLYSWL